MMTVQCQRPGTLASASRGFTLFELLVALMIFALLATMSYGGLRTVLDNRESFEMHNDRLAALQMLFLVMGRDIKQTVDRPIRDNFGDPQPALLGGSDGLELTRAGRRNPAGLRRSQLQRVGWTLEAEQVQRLSWPVLDRAQGSEAERRTMVGQVTKLEFRFLDQQGQWRLQWPASGSGDQQTTLPRAVEVTLELEDWGTVMRVYQLVAGALQPQGQS